MRRRAGRPPSIRAVAFEVTVQFKIGNFKFNRRTAISTQSVTIKNTSRTPIVGPLSLVLENLTPGVTLLNGNGDTDCTPSGPLVLLGLNGEDELSPREAETVTLQFANPGNAAIA